MCPLLFTMCPVPAWSQMCPCSERGKRSRSGAAQLSEGICPSRPERGAEQPLPLASAQPFLPAASQQIRSSLCSRCPASYLSALINPIAAWETMINCFPGERGLLIYLIRRSDGPNEVGRGERGCILPVAMVWNMYETI